MRAIALVTGFLLSCVAGQLPIRFESSRGTCECVSLYDCDKDNDVVSGLIQLDTRQDGDGPKGCPGLTDVCCLIHKIEDFGGGGYDVTAHSINGVTAPPICAPSCMSPHLCDLNLTERLMAGAGVIVPKQPCAADEKFCCAIESSTEPPSQIVNVCGTQKKNFGIINKIISGDGPTLFGEYPWTLMVLKSEDDASVANNGFVCGASLVHPSIAITAAHSVYRHHASDLIVRAGEWDTRDNNPDETLPHQERRVVEIILHEGFDNKTLYNDVAILRLEAPFRLADNVATICLPSEKSPGPHSYCVATGWGKELPTDTKYQSMMRQVSLPLVPFEECQTKLRNTRLRKTFNLHESFVCAGGKSDEDTCKGDGGGPLACIIDGTDRFYLIGITSWGVKCGTKDVPGVYANVRHLSDWINAHI